MKIYPEILVLELNHSGNFFFSKLMMMVAKIPPTMLMMYLISSSREPKLLGSRSVRAVAVPAVAAEPTAKFKIELIIVFRFKLVIQKYAKPKHLLL